MARLPLDLARAFTHRGDAGGLESNGAKMDANFVDLYDLTTSIADSLDALDGRVEALENAPAPRTAYYQSPGGSGDYAEASTALAAATIFPGAGDVQPFAFLLWVKRAVTDTFDEYLFQVACAVNGNFFTYMSDPNNDNYLQASLADGTASASGSVQYPSPDLESWALVAYAFDGVDTLSVYINGALVTQPSSSPALDWLGAGVSMTLLAASGHGSQLDASIRNIHIFDRALTSGEIAALYAAGPTHNVRAASGAWAGESAVVSWDTPAVAGVVANSGTGGACSLVLNGSVTSEVDA